MISLDRLTTFLTLCECGSYTVAAKKLYCSQPTISHHIRQLEAHLGAELIVRAGKTVQLTEQGRILKKYAAEVLALAQEAEHRVRHSLLQQQHVLPVYVSNYISEHFLSNILQRYYQENAGDMLEIHSYCYYDLRSYLLEGQTHFAIMPNYKHDEQLHKQFHSIPLFKEPLVLVAPKSHPWHQRKLLYTRDLNRQTIMMAHSDFLRLQIEENLRGIQSRNQFLQMSNFNVIKRSIISGHGISFLPYETVKHEIAQGELIMCKVSGLTIHRKNSIFIRKGITLEDRELSFIEQVRSHFHTVAV